jgi:hypothetical protein
MSQLKLNLMELVSAIRDELEQLDKARTEAGRKALFHLSAMELELNFVVEENTTAKGGFDIKVVSLGGDIGVRTEQVQKAVLKFNVPSSAINVLGYQLYNTHNPSKDKLPTGAA